MFSEIPESTSYGILKSLVERCPFGMGVLDSEQRFVTVNRAWAELNGVEEQAHLGRTVEEVLPAHYHKARESIRAAVESAQVISLEIDTDDEPFRSWDELCFPIDCGECGQFTGVIVRDITDEKLAAQQMRTISQRKDDFLALLAHELRNPLAPIANVVTLLRCIENPLAERLGEILARQLEQLQRLVAELGDASRTAAGKLELNSESIDLAESIRNSIQNTVPARAAKRQDITFNLPSSPVMLHGDGLRLTQLVSNLLSNASRYTPPGGLVGVDLSADPSAARIIVTDTGQGIAEENLARIFDQFAQVEAKRPGENEGLGLGLWLAKNVAELHGGSIRVTSEGLDCGSSFIVTLPLQAAS